MSATTATLKSQRARNPQEFEDAMGEIERSVASVQRQYGSGQQMGIDPRFSRAAPAQTYQAGEMQRRQAAVDPAFQTATAIGEREAGAQNALAQSLQKYQTSVADTALKGQQSLADTGFEKEKGLWTVDQNRRNLGFSMYKNNAERADAIQSAWDQGVAEDKLIEAGINHDIRLQDIDMYWSNVMNEVDQALRDWQSMTDADWYKFQRDMEAKSQSWGAITEGGIGILSTVLGEVFA